VPVDATFQTLCLLNNDTSRLLYHFMSQIIQMSFYRQHSVNNARCAIGQGVSCTAETRVKFQGTKYDTVAKSGLV